MHYVITANIFNQIFQQPTETGASRKRDSFAFKIIPCCGGRGFTQSLKASKFRVIS
jgi:hypothetical protein